MKLVTLICMMLFSMTVYAKTFTFIVPQKIGGGTSIWASIVAKELEPHLGKIKIKHIPGARDIPGFNKFHNGLLKDDHTVMVSHGGNGVAFLIENVDYDYREYDSVGLMNLNILAAKRNDIGTRAKIRFAGGSGMAPEGFAMALLLCGQMDDIDGYITCFRENVTWVRGMKGSERRLAFKRGELNATRENPAAYKKHVARNTEASMWFHHGLLQPNGTHADDPNHTGFMLETLYEEIYGEQPSGRMYNAYKLIKSFRDGIQKALWVRKGNPNKQRLIDALAKIQNSAKIEAKVGKYNWLIGKDGDNQIKTLLTLITHDSLSDMVRFSNIALGLKSKYKSNLVN